MSVFLLKLVKVVVFVQLLYFCLPFRCDRSFRHSRVAHRFPYRVPRTHHRHVDRSPLPMQLSFALSLSSLPSSLDADNSHDLIAAQSPHDMYSKTNRRYCGRNDHTVSVLCTRCGPVRIDDRRSRTDSCRHLVWRICLHSDTVPSRWLGFGGGVGRQNNDRGFLHFLYPFPNKKRYNLRQRKTQKEAWQILPIIKPDIVIRKYL